MEKEKSTEEKIESIENSILKLNEGIEKCEKEGTGSFVFQGQPVLPEYAKYLVEYLLDSKRAFEMKINREI